MDAHAARRSASVTASTVPANLVGGMTDDELERLVARLAASTKLEQRILHLARAEKRRRARKTKAAAAP